MAAQGPGAGCSIQYRGRPGHMRYREPADMLRRGFGESSSLVRTPQESGWASKSPFTSSLGPTPGLSAGDPFADLGNFTSPGLHQRWRGSLPPPPRLLGALTVVVVDCLFLKFSYSSTLALFAEEGHGLGSETTSCVMCVRCSNRHRKLPVFCASCQPPSPASAGT